MTTHGMRSTLTLVLHRSYDGGAWHGPALADVLAEVDAATAAARPIAGGHTIWELTHHLMAWTREVARRLDGAAAAMPFEGDWPPPPDASEAAALADEWTRLRRSLDEARDALFVSLGAFSDERFDAPAKVIGEPVTFAQTLIGLAEHNAYHGGQIVMVKRALHGAPSGAPPTPPGPPDAAAITES